MSADSGGSSRISPGTILAYLAAGGFGLYLFLMFLGMGVMAFGAAKRQYPEVVLGMILIGFAIAGMVSARADKGGGH
ncbi:MAG: hypothetical protein ACAH17_01205 [Candidatus Paceibacterota bacterium]